MTDLTPEQVIENAILSHEYGGDGKCECGTAVGFSDGIAWTVYQEQHAAVMAIRDLRELGFDMGSNQ